MSRHIMQWAGNKKQIVKFDFKNVTKIFYLSSVVLKLNIRDTINFPFTIFNFFKMSAYKSYLKQNEL